MKFSNIMKLEQTKISSILIIIIILSRTVSEKRISNVYVDSIHNNIIVVGNLYGMFIDIRIYNVIQVFCSLLLLIIHFIFCQHTHFEFHIFCY